MYTQRILFHIALVLSAHVYAAGQIPTLQELVAQRIVNEETLELAYVPQYFKDLGIDPDNIDQFTPQVQQAFVNAIKRRFGQQLNNVSLIHTLIGHNNSVYSVAISPDNKFIVTGSWDKTAKVWDSNTGHLIHTLAGHTDWLSSVAVSFDNRFIVTGSWDKTAKVWDTRYLSNTMSLQELLEHITHNYSQQ